MYICSLIINYKKLKTQNAQRNTQHFDKQKYTINNKLTLLLTKFNNNEKTLTFSADIDARVQFPAIVGARNADRS